MALLNAEIGGRRMDAEGWYHEHTFWIWNGDDLPVNVIRFMKLTTHQNLIDPRRVQSPPGWEFFIHYGDCGWSTDYASCYAYKGDILTGFQLYSPAEHTKQWDYIITSVYWDNLGRLQPGWANTGKVGGPIW